MTQPALHALLNGSAALLLSVGWLAITGRGPWRGGRNETAHKVCMLAAVAASAAFLASYLDYHYRVGSVPFWGEGWLKTVYLVVLIPHIVLAALMVPPIVLLLIAGLRGRLERHKALARWTLPVWLYVSVTGVVIYWMLYRMGPDGGMS